MENLFRILAVDNNEDNLMILDALVDEFICDAEVLTEISGPAAINIAIEVEPDAVFLDILMSGMNGFEVCEALKKIDKFKDTPVVFMTASKDDEYIQRKAISVGGYAILGKPFDIAELIALIRTLRLRD
jgi:CheY-like chemotaxis protein